MKERTDRQLEIGLSTCGGKLDDPSFFARCAEAGIAAVEISPRQNEYRELDLARIARNAAADGVRLHSFHLPFLPFEAIDVSSLNGEIRCRSVETDAELMKKAAAAGIGIFVLHASGEPVPDAERPARFAAARESVEALAETAAGLGGVLAVEDLPRSCIGRDSAEIAALIEGFPAAGVCFDTNHLLREPISAFLRAVGSRIVTTHVSDYDFADEKHWLPGEGRIDWPRLYADLLQTGYRGVWLYELGFDAPDNMPRERDLTPLDFARNAREIFSGAPIARIQT